MTAYLKVNGNSELEGDITASGLEKTTQLLYAGFTIRRSINTQVGNVGDREGGAPFVSYFVIKKEVDKISPYLAREAASGIAIPAIEIKFASTAKELSIYHIIRLENVLISSYSFNHDNRNNLASGAKPIEQINLSFTKVEIKNIPHDKYHTAGSPIIAGYDLETAKAL